ncbi:Aste57867_19391 [Aphanomyces stellatus]|uniref:Aste57867_19391 protein n=1 Tax=Aphanomyces stellatus TaxID=120398 RepID=A0A485LCF0_9STRA|nr:hypothetical protein As57867_019327 [Aphanomyces stellatus]VFT96105.1 Aste57867_19391 [Aphanomyces stellatus]
MQAMIESLEAKKREIDRLSLALQKEKIEMMAAFRAELPPTLGLIWVDDINLDGNMNFISGSWGDSTMETAWMKCSHCHVMSLTRRSPSQLMGESYTTDDNCKFCGSGFK